MVMVANRQSHYATSDMPGMKADSKGFPFDDFLAILPQRPPNRPEIGQVMVKAAISLALTSVIAVAPLSALAEVVKQWVPMTIVGSGGFCDHPPDEYVAAPDAEGGQYEHSKRPFDYVVRGDRFPAQIGLGIGVRAKLAGYGSNDSVRVRIQPPSGRSGSWEMPVEPDGEVEFGRLPATGKALEEGRYYLTVLDADRRLFTFAITLTGEAEESLCVPVS